MIPPRQQWCIQIEVTNACVRRCSNCTRLVAHVRKPFLVTCEQFAAAVDAVADFPYESESNPEAGDPPGSKMIGVMGGEPLLHPEFPKLCEIISKRVRRQHRGLWTGLDLKTHRHGKLAAETFAYINRNRHDRPCYHQPILVGIQEIVDDEEDMWGLIEKCPLQRRWASAVTPKGFFCCEVAASLDMVFDGPGGLPITPGCWRHDLAEYRNQIERWCPRCGMCLPLNARRDTEEKDDISPGNLEALRSLGSPRVLASEYVVYDTDKYRPPTSWEPLRYLGRPR